MKRIGTITLAVVGGIIVGCTTPTQERVSSRIDEDKSVADERLGRLLNEESSFFEAHDGVYLGGDIIEPPQVEKLPEAFDQRIEFKRSYPVTIYAVADHISQHTGYRVLVTPDVATGDPASQNANQSRQQQDNEDPLPGQAISPLEVVVNYEGTAGGLLEYITKTTNSFYEFSSESGVKIYRVKSQTWEIAAFPGDVELEATLSNQNTIGGQGGGGGQQGGATTGGGQTTTMTTNLEVMQGIDATVRALLSPLGDVAVMESTGMVTVTDVPSVLATVDQVMARVNRRLGSMVVIDVRVVSLDLGETEEYGFNWNVVYDNLNKRYGIENTILSGLEPTGQNTFGVAILDPTDAYFGSGAVVEALSTEGRISNVTNQAVATLTNQPASVQVARLQGYLADVSTQQVSDAGIVTSLETGTITSGTTMTLLPVVLQDQQIMLQIQFNQADLLGLDEFISGDNRIQNPNVDARNTLQRVKLRSGQTLVLSGFAQTRSGQDHRGIGKPRFWGLGGGVSSQQSETLLVLMMTPRIIG